PRLEIQGGERANIVVRPVLDSVGTLGEPVDLPGASGSKSGFDLRLEPGIYRATLRGDGGRFAEVPLASAPGRLEQRLRVRLAAPREAAAVPPTEVRSVETPGLGSFDAPVPPPYGGVTVGVSGGIVAPFVVDAACLTNRDYIAFAIDEYSGPRRPRASASEWLVEALVERGLPDDMANAHRDGLAAPSSRWNTLPVTRLDWYDAVALAASLGKRLPSLAESRAVSYGADPSWITDPSLGPIASRFNVGNNAGTGPSGLISFASYLAAVEPAVAREPMGPVGTYHALGNVEEWTDTPTDVGAFRELPTSGAAFFIATNAWPDPVEALDPVTGRFTGVVDANGPFVTTGIRCVRSAAPV
ncbi:MAG: SUMF1/EgtB/PvdO family nonheme iron enzyme, partial [Planctomycetes bacterium]|nr:SUMF1/EgtB/PvdO family nonheme iron enzyme [Planctomycetota bacterium]